MTRLLAISVLVLGLSAFAQQPKDPRGDMTEAQKCQMKCGQEMNACMMPCTGGDPAEASKPENRGKMMACVKKCADANQPCTNACKKK